MRPVLPRPASAATAVLAVILFALPSRPAAAAAAPASARPMVVPFIADDFERAVSEARASQRPIFVEVWAPWCHTCRSMRAYVFTDPALASRAPAFEWLEINSEQAANAAFLKRYPTPALPSYLILDPSDRRVALRWVGGATVQQLLKLLDDGRMAVAAGAAPAPGDSPADAAFARAEKLYAAGSDSAAASAYEEALRLAPAGWARESRAVESLLFALTQIGANERAAKRAIDAFPRLSRSSSAGNVAASGLEAALEIPAATPGRDALVERLERDCRSVVSDRSIPMAADDRSAVYIALLDRRSDVPDSAGARQVASEWATFLEGEAARAPTPDARAVFDSHRLSAYLALGEPERAIPMLNASERDLPDDYNPPARLAVAYRALRRWPEALAASDRALKKAYGPRSLGMLQVRSDIYLGLADTVSARRTLDDAVHTAEGFPEGQRSPNAIAALRKKREALH